MIVQSRFLGKWRRLLVFIGIEMGRASLCWSSCKELLDEAKIS
jgi:hypothetical protein